MIVNTYRKIFKTENPGITHTQSRDFEIGKIGRDSGIAIPTLKSIAATLRKVSGQLCSFAA